MHISGNAYESLGLQSIICLGHFITTHVIQEKTDKRCDPKDSLEFSAKISLDYVMRMEFIQWGDLLIELRSNIRLAVNNEFPTGLGR